MLRNTLTPASSHRNVMREGRKTSLPLHGPRDTASRSTTSSKGQLATVQNTLFRRTFTRSPRNEGNGAEGHQAQRNWPCREEITHIFTVPQTSCKGETTNIAPVGEKKIRPGSPSLCLGSRIRAAAEFARAPFGKPRRQGRHFAVASYIESWIASMNTEGPPFQ